MEIILKVSAALEMKLAAGYGVAPWLRMCVCVLKCASEVMLLFNLTKSESRMFVFLCLIPPFFTPSISILFGDVRIKER